MCACSHFLTLSVRALAWICCVSLGCFVLDLAPCKVVRLEAEVDALTEKAAKLTEVGYPNRDLETSLGGVGVCGGGGGSGAGV
jgi:hypothetical protein